MEMTYDSPIRGRHRATLPDGTIMDFLVWFLAMDLPKDCAKVKSLEPTFAWLNEAAEIDKDIFIAVRSRLGRYAGTFGAAMVMDTNPPDDDHWWYNLAEVTKPARHRFFAQPGGVLRVNDGDFTKYIPNPLAENIDGLVKAGGYDYYLRQTEGADPAWIDVMLMGEYGTIQAGKPVYASYSDSRHCIAADKLNVMRGLPIRLGWDYGRTPACVIGQLSPRGQLVIHDELVSEDMGIRTFSREVVIPFLNNKYAGIPVVSHGDPAGNQRAQTDDRTCHDELREAGIPTTPAHSNALIARLGAVDHYLRRTIDGGKPAFLLSDACRVLRKGFRGGYKYERIQVAGEARYRDMPEKNAYSHPHDALQYLTMGTGGEAVPVANKSKALPVVVRKI